MTTLFCFPFLPSVLQFSQFKKKYLKSGCIGEVNPPEDLTTLLLLLHALHIYYRTVYTSTMVLGFSAVKRDSHFNLKLKDFLSSCNKSRPQHIEYHQPQKINFEVKIQKYSQTHWLAYCIIRLVQAFWVCSMKSQ